MKLVSIKNDSDISLNNVSVEVDRHDSAVKRVTVKDADGNFIVVSTDCGALSILKKAPPKKEKRWTVSGEVSETHISQTYSDKGEAENIKYALEMAGGKVTITETEVEVSEEE